MARPTCALRLRGRLTLLVLCMSQGLVLSIGGVSASPAPAPSHAARAHVRVPFGVGEQLLYDVFLDSHKVGTAQMSVEGIESVRGRLAYHIVYTIAARTHFLFYTYHVNDRFESWLDIEKLVSLRYLEMQGRQDDGRYRLRNTYDIFPEEANYKRVVYRAKEGAEEPAVLDQGVRQPLDPCSLVYFVRSSPLRVKQAQTYDNYFKRDHNPVSLRSEDRLASVRVPAVVASAGRTDAVVVHPTIQDRGMFSKDAGGAIWFSDDSRYLPVQISFHENLGPIRINVSLRLASYRSPHD